MRYNTAITNEKTHHLRHRKKNKEKSYFSIYYIYEKQNIPSSESRDPFFTGPEKVSRFLDASEVLIYPGEEVLATGDARPGILKYDVVGEGGFDPEMF